MHLFRCQDVEGHEAAPPWQRVYLVRVLLFMPHCLLHVARLLGLAPQTLCRSGSGCGGVRRVVSGGAG